VDNQHPTPLGFLDLSETLMEEWRKLPVTRLFLNHLQEERQRSLDQSADFLYAGGAPSQAAGRAGAAIALFNLHGQCTHDRTEVPFTAQDDTFQDPRRRKATIRGT